MYLDALEFLDEERDAWAPFEALASLSDDQLEQPVAAAHGWSGRQLMGHLLGWQDNAMTVAKELAVAETSATKTRSDEEWEARGGHAVNADLDAAWSALFFGWRSPGLAFAEIVLLWLAILATVLAFSRVSTWAAALLVPYLAWVSFAAVLNGTIWRLNA